MSDRLATMSILVACVDAGSLTAGARRLGMPLATVSRRVAALEEQIGTQLLHRSARGLALTDAGTSYVAACRRILEDVAEAERIAAGEFTLPNGLLTLAAPIVFGRMHVVPVVAAFLGAYPQIDVRLAQADRLVNLLEEHIDVAVRIGPLPDSGLRARRVGDVRWVCCAAPAYLAERGRPMRARDLAGHDCISFAGHMATDRWRFGTSGAEVQVPIRSRMVVNTAEAAIDAAAAGVGVARVLSYQVAGAVADGRLERILRDDEPDPMPVNILYGGGLVPRKVRAFVDFARPRLAAALKQRAG
ncbi:MAG: LysR family transcriptional regulator [Maritimibacter sp.]|nr:LysR family transcriptional regulator [Maritimibacter sp.]